MNLPGRYKFLRDDPQTVFLPAAGKARDMNAYFLDETGEERINHPIENRRERPETKELSQPSVDSTWMPQPVFENQRMASVTSPHAPRHKAHRASARPPCRGGCSSA